MHPKSRRPQTISCGTGAQGSKINTQPFANTVTQEQIADRFTWQPTLTFLNYGIFTILAASACYLLAILVLMPEQYARAYPLIPWTVVAIVGAFLMRREWYLSAVYWIAAGAWTIITVSAILHGGVSAPIYYAHPILIIFLGWAVGTRAALAALALTAAATTGLVVADSERLLPKALPAAPLLYAIVQVFVMLLSLALIVLLVKAYRQRLHEMQVTKREIENAYVELRQSELKFSTAFASSPVAASITTLFDGRYIDVNNNFVRDFGWSRADLIGKTTVAIGLWPDPMSRQKLVEMLNRHGRTVDFETTWCDKSGARRYVSISGEIIELDNVPCILAYITDISARKAAEDHVQRLAFFDPLTNLPNRRLLNDRLDQAMTASVRHQRLGALLFIDLDNFKTVNDTHGHAKGDMLLAQVGTRLDDAVRDGDTVARLGGDEFVVMLEDLSQHAAEAATQAENVGRKLLAALNESYDVDEVFFNVTPSIGVTLFGLELELLEEPLKRADLAMYQAKAAGRNTIRFFDPRMQALVIERATMESDLRTALQMDQFELYYQPQVQRGGLTKGVEVLVRWRHPVRGMVMPGDFIPLLEETGLILPVGARILEMACQQLALWAGRPGMAHLTLAVNVSARQFQQDDFVELVLDVLARTGAPARRLQLELTESLLIDNVDEVIAKMDAIKAHGVGFALDDFGTGYSSLSYLKRLPLDQLKIDRSFVRDILVDANDAAIARMVILLAESLGLEVLAEGVESNDQQQALHKQGCHLYQGYHFSRPIPIDEFERWAAQPGWPIITLDQPAPVSAPPSAPTAFSAPEGVQASLL